MKLRQKLRIKFGQTLFKGMAGVDRLISGVSLNIFDPEFARDPYPHFNALRQKEPIFYSRALRAWWVTRFDLVQEVLKDNRFGADIREFESRMKLIRKEVDEQQLKNIENPSMLGLNPPDHGRIRKLVSRGFLFKFIQSLEPRIQAIVDGCFERVNNQPGFDVIDILAKPLPAIVIAEMMGLPEEDHQQFQDWSEDLIEGTGTNDTRVMEKSMAANRALIEYFRNIIESRRGNPGDDLIGQLIAAEEAGDKLTAGEVYRTCLLLLVAGHETTTRLIGNGLYLLLKQPEVFNALKDDPTLIAPAIEEMLRFEPPVQATQRFVREDMDFHGHHFKKGDIVLVSISAANRDPDANENPEVFDPQREKINQISFGYGIHLCIGATLARLEAKVAFESLLRQFPRMELTDKEPAWGTNPFFRGLDHLNITVDSNQS
jgi:cytochrome P450